MEIYCRSEWIFDKTNHIQSDDIQWYQNVQGNLPKPLKFLRIFSLARHWRIAPEANSNFFRVAPWFPWSHGGMEKHQFLRHHKALKSLRNYWLHPLNKLWMIFKMVEKIKTHQYLILWLFLILWKYCVVSFVDNIICSHSKSPTVCSFSFLHQPHGFAPPCQEHSWVHHPGHRLPGFVVSEERDVTDVMWSVLI